MCAVVCGVHPHKMANMRVLAAAASLCLCARATFIDNLAPRRDSAGAVMDSHDFSLRKYPGTAGYTMVSIAYGECREPASQGCDQTPDKCGFQPNHTINVWQSPDLSSGSWSLVTTAVSLDNRPPGTIYRPDAIWNPHSKSVVLWYNWLNAQGQYMGYAAYTAPTPAGPYSRVRESVNVTMQNATEQCGDFHLFVDPADGTPYIIAGCGFHSAFRGSGPCFCCYRRRRRCRRSRSRSRSRSRRSRRRRRSRSHRPI